MQSKETETIPLKYKKQCGLMSCILIAESAKKKPKPQKPKLPMRNEYAGNEKIINHTLNYAFFQRTCGTNYV